MENYLTVNELGAMIRMAPQTIYNKIHKKEFILGIHYLKPSRKKILFKESAIIDWLGSTPEEQTIQEQPEKINSTNNRQKKLKNLINI